jgi:hypothetical protein
LPLFIVQPKKITKCIYVKFLSPLSPPYGYSKITSSAGRNGCVVCRVQGEGGGQKRERERERERDGVHSPCFTPLPESHHVRARTARTTPLMASRESITGERYASSHAILKELMPQNLRICHTCNGPNSQSELEREVSHCTYGTTGARMHRMSHGKWEGGQMS